MQTAVPNPSFNPKVEVLQELLELIMQREEKVLIYAPSKRYILHLLQLLSPHYEKSDIVYFTGDVKNDQRQAAIEAINTGSAKICLITTNTGGVGIQLTGANNVIFMQQSWNTGSEYQAVSRAHRPG